MGLHPGSAGEGNELAGVVSFLRQELEVIAEEKQLSRHEADRLRSEVNILKRTIDSLKGQLASEDKRHQRLQKEEALFKERKETQANYNMVKESNASLRSRFACLSSIPRIKNGRAWTPPTLLTMRLGHVLLVNKMLKMAISFLQYLDKCILGRSQNEELDKLVRSLRAEVQNLTKAQRPQELEVMRLKADIENKQAETKLVGQTESIPTLICMSLQQLQMVKLCSKKRLGLQVLCVIARTDILQLSGKAFYRKRRRQIGGRSVSISCKLGMVRWIWRSTGG